MAEQLSAEEQAAKDAAAAAKKQKLAVKVRVLIDCEHGKCGAVASLGADEAVAALKAGLVDDAAAAVKYAEKANRAAAAEQDE